MEHGRPQDAFRRALPHTHHTRPAPGTALPPCRLGQEEGTAGGDVQDETLNVLFCLFQLLQLRGVASGKRVLAELSPRNHTQKKQKPTTHS